jgi:hypothetical protein
MTAAVEAVLGAAAVGGAAWLVLRDLAPPRPPRPPRPPKPARTPPAGTVLPQTETPSAGSPAPTAVALLPDDRHENQLALDLDVEVVAPLVAPTQPLPTAAPVDLLERIAAVEPDRGTPIVRRTASALTLLTLTALTAVGLGMLIYRGLTSLG